MSSMQIPWLRTLMSSTGNLSLVDADFTPLRYYVLPLFPKGQSAMRAFHQWMDKEYRIDSTVLVIWKSISWNFVNLILALVSSIEISACTNPGVTMITLPYKSKFGIASLVGIISCTSNCQIRGSSSDSNIQVHDILSSLLRVGWLTRAENLHTALVYRSWTSHTAPTSSSNVPSVSEADGINIPSRNHNLLA